LSIFDLLFILVVLTSAATLLVALTAALRGHFNRAGKILRNWAICAAAYIAIAFLVSFLLPRRVLNLHDLQCSDDWCIAVENVTRTPAAPEISVHIELRLSSRARRVSQRENGIIVYLTDDRGRRYHPAPDPSAIPFNVLLEPGQSVIASRSFKVPGDAVSLNLVVTHEGGFPIGRFIIGRSPFDKSTVVRLD